MYSTIRATIDSNRSRVMFERKSALARGARAFTAGSGPARRVRTCSIAMCACA